VRLYERAGLLTDKTIMAHGVTLTDEELQLLARRGAALAHCPLSNFFFADVPLNVLNCLGLGMKVSTFFNRPGLFEVCEHECRLLLCQLQPLRCMMSAEHAPAANGIL
jgi:adenosine deaminase